MELTIAVDFDGVFTAHPQLFSELATTALSFGFEVVTVTSRRKTLENEQAMRAAGVTWPIIFAYDKPKKLAAIEAEVSVDVWLDDQPHMIGNGGESLECVGVFENELRHSLAVIRGIETVTETDVGRALDQLQRRLETVLGAA